MKQERLDEVMSVTQGIVLDDLKRIFSLITLLEDGKYVNWKHAVECANEAIKTACHLGLWTKNGKGYIQSVRIYSTTKSEIAGTFVDKFLEETLTSPQYETERNAKGPFKIEFTLTRVTKPDDLKPKSPE